MPRFDSFSQSNSIGLHHSENQDSFLVDETNSVAAVADGVGGYSGAKDASSYAIDMLSRKASKVNDELSLDQLLAEIHSGIQGKARELGFVNMGTTLAVAKLLRDDRALIGNVGDSPILLFRKTEMIQVYEDDSHRSQDPMSMYAIIQYLGLDCELEAHVKSIRCYPGDALLLCSDGITDNLLNSQRGKLKLASLAKSGDARGVVKAAIEERIKPDDMTAVLISF